MQGAECARKKLISWSNPKGKLLISHVREPGTGTSLQGSLLVQGCTLCLSAQPGRTCTTVTSFPEASKISSVFGRTLPLHGPWEGSWQEPVTPSLQEMGADPQEPESCPDASHGAGEWLSPRSSGHRHQVLPAQGSSPLLCVCPLSSPSPMAAPAQDLLFPDLCFPLPLDEATKHSKRSTLQASPRPHLQLEWPLFWLPTNTVYLIP